MFGNSAWKSSSGSSWKKQHAAVEQLLQEHMVLLAAIAWEQYVMKGHGALNVDMTSVSGRRVASASPGSSQSWQNYVSMAYLSGE